MDRPRRFAILLVVNAVLSGSAFAFQADQGTKSLAEIAAGAKSTPHEHARIVLDDDSGDFTKPVIPDVFSGGIDNSDQIVTAIFAYQKTHSPKETEDVIHRWYDKHDAILARAIDENKRIDDRNVDRRFLDGTRYDARTPEQYQAEYAADLRSQRDDYKEKMSNGLLSARIQQTFTKVRGQLQSHNIKYEWFKIRCGNGNCSF